VGNHEYHSDGASGYARYFAGAAGDPKRALQLRAWGVHIVVITANAISGADADAGFRKGVAQRIGGIFCEVHAGLLAQAPVSSGAKHGMIL